MEKTMEATIMGYLGTTIRIHSFIPSYPKGKLFGVVDIGFTYWG